MILFQTKRDIFYIKNNIKNLYKVLKHIKSAFSNKRNMLLLLFAFKLIYIYSTFYIILLTSTLVILKPGFQSVVTVVNISM